MINDFHDLIKNILNIKLFKMRILCCIPRMTIADYSKIMIYFRYTGQHTNIVLRSFIII